MSLLERISQAQNISCQEHVSSLRFKPRSLWRKRSRFSGALMNCPCRPCPSDSSTWTYCPLYFVTHVHYIHCYIESPTNMKVDWLFVHPETAHIIPKKWTNSSSALHLWRIVQSVFYVHFLWHFVHVAEANSETCISSNVTFWPCIFGPILANLQQWQIVPWLESWDFWSK